MHQTFQLCLARWSFGGAARLKFFRRLAEQLRHRMDLEKILVKQQERARARRSPQATVYACMLESLGTGHSLGESLTGFAPPEEIMLISAGQRAGQTIESLRLTAGLIEARLKIKKAMREALAYPAFLLCLLVVLLCVVSFYVVPKLSAISNPETWYGPARNLFLAANFIASEGGLITLIIFFILGCLTIYSLPRWTGKFRVRADKIPPWSIYRLTVGAMWLFTTATLMKSNIQIAYILDDMLNSPTTTPWLKERMHAIRSQYDLGKNFGDSLFDSGMQFPDTEIVDDLRDYAALPKFHEHLHAIASDWMETGIELIQRQAQIMRTTCIMLIITVVCNILLAMGSLQQQLSSTVGGF